MAALRRNSWSVHFEAIYCCVPPRRGSEHCRCAVCQSCAAQAAGQTETAGDPTVVPRALLGSSVLRHACVALLTVGYCSSYCSGRLALACPTTRVGCPENRRVALSLVIGERHEHSQQSHGIRFCVREDTEGARSGLHEKKDRLDADSDLSTLSADHSPTAQNELAAAAHAVLSLHIARWRLDAPIDDIKLQLCRGTDRGRLSWGARQPRSDHRRCCGARVGNSFDSAQISWFLGFLGFC